MRESRKNERHLYDEDDDEYRKNFEIYSYSQ